MLSFLTCTFWLAQSMVFLTKLMVFLWFSSNLKLRVSGFFKLLAPSGCAWPILTAPGCSWLLLAAPGGSWLLLAAPGACPAPGCSLAVPYCSWLLPALLLAAAGCSWWLANPSPKFCKQQLNNLPQRLRIIIC